MDASVLSGLSTGGIGAAILGVAYLTYNCILKKHIVSKCCGGSLDISNEKSSPRTIEIVSTAISPKLEPKENPERRLSTIEV